MELILDRLTANWAQGLHHEAIVTWGGDPSGPRQGCVEGSIGAAISAALYESSEGEPINLLSVAAGLLYYLTSNHCFTDGNKRVALTSMDVFLQLNGHELVVSEPETVIVMNAVAEGSMTEAQLEAWVEQHVAPLTPGDPSPHD